MIKLHLESFPGHKGRPGQHGGSTPSGDMGALAEKYGFKPTERKDTFRREWEEPNKYGTMNKTRLTVFNIPGKDKYVLKTHINYTTPFGPNSAGGEVGTFDTAEEAFWRGAEIGKKN